MSKKALVILAPEIEEMEFVISVSVLVRGGLDVTVAGIPGAETIKCSRGVKIEPDVKISDAKSREPYEVIVLPGGLGGSKAMAESKDLGELLREQEKNGKLIAGICAAPLAFEAHGIAFGKNITSYPTRKALLEEGGHYKYLEQNVVVDGNLITSRSPGTAFDFALTIIDKLQGKEKAAEVAKGMLLNYSRLF